MFSAKIANKFFGFKNREGGQRTAIETKERQFKQKGGSCCVAV